jgi:hypothetical protein
MIAAPELLRIRWNKNLTRNAAGAPLIAPLFVAEQGPAIQVAGCASASPIDQVSLNPSVK